MRSLIKIKNTSLLTIYVHNEYVHYVHCIFTNVFQNFLLKLDLNENYEYMQSFSSKTVKLEEEKNSLPVCPTERVDLNCVSKIKGRLT